MKGWRGMGNVRWEAVGQGEIITVGSKKKEKKKKQMNINILVLNNLFIKYLL